MTWFFDPLERGCYDMIMVDNPWPFDAWSDKGINAKSAQGQYPCMPIEEIMKLPVADLGKKDCLLMMWVTNPMIDQQMPVIKAWGFIYLTLFTWTKKTKNGKKAFGTGRWGRSSTEHIALAKRGEPRTFTRSERTEFDGVVGRHSEKPNTAYRLAERLMPPGARRADIFSRRERGGWDQFGDEVDKFNWSR